MVYVTKSFCRFASFPVLGATLTRDEDVGAIRASEISKVMVYALELPILLVLLLLLLLLLLTTSTNGTASTSACSGVVATISRPCNGLVAEPFCRFAPHPVEGVSLTIGVVPFALSRFTLTPETKQKHNQKQVQSANIVSATTRRKQSLFLSRLPS